MSKITKAVSLGATLLAFTLPARAQDAKCAQDIHGLLSETQAKSAEVLQKCAASQGVTTSGTPVLLATEGSSAAIVPVEGIADLKRDDLNDWKTLGVFSAQGPEGADAPSGTFTIRAQADPGSEKGKFQIVDANGKVVQEGEMDIEIAPEGSAAKGAGQLFAPSAVGMPPGKPGAGDKLVSGYPCAYYPFYYYPFYIHPYYYYGCHYWVYSWPWGHLRLRYCWWPWYYYYPCWWYGYCW